MSQLDLFSAGGEPECVMDHGLYLNYLIAQGRIRHSDIALAKLLNKNETNDIFYLILLLLQAEQNQHSCLAFTDIDWNNPFSLVMELMDETIPMTPWACSTGTKIWQGLVNHHAVGEGKPLQLFAQRLYLSRLANYEVTLAERFKQMQAQKISVDSSRLTALLTDYFGVTNLSTGEVDWQKVACAMAATQGFCVLTGGPGTGKTTTVTKLLAILQSLYHQAPLTIKLVAPTGKAAARLSESILGAKAKLNLMPEVSNLIPEHAQTIHRLLGVIPNSNRYRFNADNQLHLDVLIVDEASMVDLSLLAKLVRAIPAHARLILLGDKDQLTSVDTGSVLSDLCQGLTLGDQPPYSESLTAQLNELCFEGQTYLHPRESEFCLADSIAFLQTSHRFDSHSGIGQLAFSVNNNSRAQLSHTIEQGYQDLALFDLNTHEYTALIIRAAMQYRTYLELMHQGASPVDIHHAFGQYQLLAAVKEGPYGVKTLNKRIEQQLSSQGLINPSGRYYAGLPIMITKNDYQLKLFNGDIGILLPDEEGQLKAVFIDEQGEHRSFYPARLPNHSSVFVMTIHKSQGSEFSHTAMILPPKQRASRGINRQLVYTGITRAKHKFELIAQPKVLHMAMTKSVSRCSGLRERLLTR
ncbi:exodeoxyribonuclease V subunit alpha [Pseudoalteromonas sp. MMG005]|nr:exodeoxyribonuclease V subunit alpha [Pseudoalteromonas sp. MMG005]